MERNRAADRFVERAIAGDRDALSSLLERAAGPLSSHLRGRIAQQWLTVLDVDDVIQVTFLEAFLRVEQLVATEERAFLAWLTRIADNNLRDAIRGLECEKRPPPGLRIQPTPQDSVVSLLDVLGVTSATPSRGAARGEAKELLEEALLRLPPDYATVIRLYDLQRMSAPEIAERLGKSRGNVHMLRSRGLAWLRELLVSDSRFFSEA
jgi:RNA polymerase sigma-70 factor (ECF subfamily)